MEKAIFIDECWQLIGGGGNSLAAEYVLEIFKIIRGYPALWNWRYTPGETALLRISG